ncbi:putative serine dehydratase domain-containing protein [Aspergillus cavernicola]|uniref:Serine dehydratase domain-containing protein n=1 Tax=Aspergillus cavernicola TaxID=176166 RepID=A0ABR4IXK3_9EURO
MDAYKFYIGKPAIDLPTPSVILSKPTIERNINQLHQDVKNLGITFRPHVKTLKSLEVTRMMLGNGQHRKIVASTIPEIEGTLPLVKEGVLDECLYSMPIYPSVLPRLLHLSTSLKIVLMIDNEQHIDLLEKFSSSVNAPQPWPVFIKIDVGTRRAGMVKSSYALPTLVQRVERSNAVELYGFYCHAGHSYACRSSESAAEVLKDEVEGVLSASKHLTSTPASASTRKVVVSIGSTPTAHVVSSLKEVLPEYLQLELHAGNFPCNDLQQLCTSLIRPSGQSLRVLSEVCSVYPERNEALINAGTIALSKETSDIPGYARVSDSPQWAVLRMSQEHGILGFEGAPEVLKVLGVDRDGVREEEKAEEEFRVGDKVFLWCQHACITAAAHSVYFVVDEGDVVREVWVPWKGW